MTEDDVKAGVIAILLQARDDIRANMSQRGVNASGRTSASIRVRETDTGFALVGGGGGVHIVSGQPRGEDVTAGDTAPIPTLEVGRPGGRVPRGFYYILKQWTRDKGLAFAKESERQTFAYVLAKKIARSGTRRHVAPVDVFSTPAKNAAKNIQSDMSLRVATEIKKVLTNW